MNETTNTDTVKCQLEANVFECVMTSCFVRQATLYIPTRSHFAR